MTLCFLQMPAKTLTSNSTTMKRKLTQSQDQNRLEAVPFWGMALWPLVPRPRVLTGIFNTQFSVGHVRKNLKRSFTTHF